MWKQNRRRFPSLVTGLVLIVCLAAAAIFVASRLLTSPFTTTTVDHSPPPVLVNLRDLSEYHAAQAQFEVTIDQEHDVAWLPSTVLSTSGISPTGPSLSARTVPLSSSPSLRQPWPLRSWITTRAM